MQYRAAAGGEWQNASLAGSESDSGRLVRRYAAGRLRASSQYWFRLQLVYSSGALFVWPDAGEYFVFTTAGQWEGRRWGGTIAIVGYAPGQRWTSHFLEERSHSLLITDA